MEHLSFRKILRNFYHDYLNNKIIPCKGLELLGQELNAPEM